MFNCACAVPPPWGVARLGEGSRRGRAEQGSGGRAGSGLRALAPRVACEIQGFDRQSCLSCSIADMCLHRRLSSHQLGRMDFRTRLPECRRHTSLNLSYIRLIYINPTLCNFGHLFPNASHCCFAGCGSSLDQTL